jgi:hypothetical protein
VKVRCRMISIAIAIGAGCGDDSPYVPQADQTFTTFVIDLVTNHDEDPEPVPYTVFADLPDPDGDTNHAAAYEALFQ